MIELNEASDIILGYFKNTFSYFNTTLFFVTEYFAAVIEKFENPIFQICFLVTFSKIICTQH